MKTTKITLQGVLETLLMPLWGRAFETKKENPLLVDKEAVRIVESLDYDFSRIGQKVNPLSRASWIARSLYFDANIREYLEENPNGTVINLGCGLDTTFERVHNGKAKWYELDFPEVIETRKKVLNESPDRVFLPCSALDQQWYEKIKDRENALIMMPGVIYYFKEKEVQELFRTFKSRFRVSTVICDYSSQRGVRIANKKVIGDGGMDASARLKWGIDDIKEIERWDAGISVIENMKMFADHRKKYPLGKRLGMWISDALSVMSLAKITIR